MNKNKMEIVTKIKMSCPITQTDKKGQERHHQY